MEINMDIVTLVISFILSLISAVVAALVTAKLALKGFYNQELWLRKETQYSNILNKLGLLYKHYSNRADLEMGVPEDIMNEIDEKEHKKALKEIEILSVTPSYIINVKVNEVLKNLVLESRKRSISAFEFYDNMS